jgi:hypothetical protein
VTMPDLDTEDPDTAEDAGEDTAAEAGGGAPGDGVRLDLISAERMAGMASMEKIRLILDGVHDGKIVVLEEGLSPDEESKLIEVTMNEISPDEFAGIEIESYPEEPESSFIDRIMGTTGAPLTVIGPANRIETLHKDESLISTLVSE